MFTLLFTASMMAVHESYRDGSIFSKFPRFGGQNEITLDIVDEVMEDTVQSSYIHGLMVLFGAVMFIPSLSLLICPCWCYHEFTQRGRK